MTTEVRDIEQRLRRRVERERAARLEAEAIAERFTRAATHDPLTGLANRAHILERLDLAIERHNPQRHHVGVLFVDLDDLRAVNDRHGYDIGDELIKVVAERLVGATRTADTVARLGGDEFVVVCDYASSVDEVQQIAQRVLHVVAEPVRLRGLDLSVTASVGVRIATPGETADGLLRDADAAMYHAKTTGKGRAASLGGPTFAHERRRSALESDLAEALRTDQLTVWLQPVVRLGDRTVTAAEALARWRHPHRGVVPPTEFVPLAEATGLIVDLDRLAFAKACRHAVLADFEGAGIGIRTNAAVETLQEPAYVREVTRTLRSYGLSTRMLTIEITERSLATDSPILHENLASLRAQGVSLAIDDFGQAYSSFAYLRRLPLDALKIDSSFVSGVGVLARDEAIVSAIVAVAKALGMSTVAEGVETEVQADTLTELGVDEAQGWFFGVPAPAERWSEPVVTRPVRQRRAGGSGSAVSPR